MDLATSESPARAAASPIEQAWARIIASPLVLAVILLIAFAVYAPTLDDWFQADDFWLLRPSQTTPVGDYVVEALDFRTREPVPAFGFYRPLYIISVRLSYALFGLNAVGYHALNVALHLGSTALLWLIARRLTQLPLAAAAAALIFALHPAYTETVAWIARGNTVMVTFVYLLSFLLFMKHMEGGRRSLVYYAGSLVGFTAAILYHPTALGLAAALPAYAFLVAGRPADALRVRPWLRFVPFALIAAAMVGIQTWHRDHVGMMDEGFKFGWHQYTRYREYLGLALFPVLKQDWLRLELPRPGLLDTLHELAAVAMLASTLVLLVRRRWPYLGVFGVWWFYTSLAPNSTEAVFGAIPAQLYLPGVSLAVFFVVAVLWAKEAVPPAMLSPAARAAAVLLAAFLLSSIALALSHQRGSDRNGGEARTFVTQLRESVPALSPGGTLYVVDPPLNLVVFNDSALDAAVALYYGDVEVRAISMNQVAEVERSLRPRDQIFYYRP